MAEDDGGERRRGAVSVSMGRSPTIEIRAQHPRFVRDRGGRVPRKQVGHDEACVGEDDGETRGHVAEGGLASDGGREGQGPCVSAPARAVVVGWSHSRPAAR